MFESLGEDEGDITNSCPGIFVNIVGSNHRINLKFTFKCTVRWVCLPVGVGLDVCE